MKIKNSVLLFCIYFILFTTLILYTTFPEELTEIERSLEFQTVVDIDKKNLFDILANIQDYPLILPDYYNSVEILNKTTNSFLTVETVNEAGIQATFKVQHVLNPYESHHITIVDGDAKDSTIIIWFTDLPENKTQIIVQSDLKFKGLMRSFALLPDENLNHALNTLLDKFVKYTINTKNS